MFLGLTETEIQALPELNNTCPRLLQLRLRYADGEQVCSNEQAKQD
jgi:hypothetical protein